MGFRWGLARGVLFHSVLFCLSWLPLLLPLSCSLVAISNLGVTWEIEKGNLSVMEGVNRSRWFDRTDVRQLTCLYD
jgi:hypothetical protein